jgi:hypothetical protein
MHILPLLPKLTTAVWSSIDMQDWILWLIKLSVYILTSFEICHYGFFKKCQRSSFFEWLWNTVSYFARNKNKLQVLCLNLICSGTYMNLRELKEISHLGQYIIINIMFSLDHLNTVRSLKSRRLWCPEHVPQIGKMRNVLMGKCLGRWPLEKKNNKMGG